MVTILLRTLIVYITLILIMRLMGKRQIGELEVTDLVTTLLISEIAALPITNHELPVLAAVIPMITLLSLEVLSSWILVRFPRLRGLVSATPTVIVLNGRLKQSALLELRLSLEELMGEIRRQGLVELSQVDCAILEKNGNLTILPKPEFSPPTAGQLGMKPPRDELMHIVYCNGVFSKKGLALIEKNIDWLERELLRHNLCKEDLFCVTANASGKLFWLKKE